jgi:hypothetical protein
MALLSLPLITRRRRALAVRPQADTPVVPVEPASEPELAVVPARTNPYVELEKALTTGQARLGLMRSLRGY